jgi:hypothetical protein
MASQRRKKQMYAQRHGLGTCDFVLFGPLERVTPKEGITTETKYFTTHLKHIHISWREIVIKNLE